MCFSVFFMAMKINCLIQGETLMILMVVGMMLVIRDVTDAVYMCMHEEID